MKRTVVSSLVALALAAPAFAATYEIDESHSSVGFRIRHLVGRVSGRFDKFQGSIDYAEGRPQEWRASASIDATSINTANAKRDDHLRNADFFDVAKCPKIEFAAKRVTAAKGNKAKLHGELTMHCTTKPVVLDLEINGVTLDPWGNNRIGVTATGKLNRKDFGMSYNKILDTGGLMLGEDVQLELEIEGVSKAAQKAVEKQPKKG